MPASEIMRRFYAGDLKSSNGAKVTELAQAKAIASSYGKSEDKKMKSGAYAKATKAIGKKAAGSGLKTSELHIKRGHKGGYIAKHHLEDKDGNPHHKTHEYPLASMAALKKHIDEHMPEESAEAGGDAASAGQGGEMPQSAAAENTEV